jgi:hypothetical protein
MCTETSCYYCRHTGGHDPMCPGRPTVEWQRGRDAGRAGEEPKSGLPVYMLGWQVGRVALEEAENGHDPRFV